jgi:hypothetical protein
MAPKLTGLTHRIAIQLPTSGRELYHLQFSLQAANPETFGYIILLRDFASPTKTDIHVNQFQS